MQQDDGHLEPVSQAQLKTHYAEGGTGMPDVVFKVGEKVKLKDGDFRIQSIGRKLIVLEGLPGTRLSR